MLAASCFLRYPSRACNRAALMLASDLSSALNLPCILCQCIPSSHRDVVDCPQRVWSVVPCGRAGFSEELRQCSVRKIWHKVEFWAMQVGYND
ncbi:hypothetical protein PLICRDRAFT_610613 [Plicaturopsis crispa FD-325 SS-3]|nr:hypothetical protein PLICRDRAFT_610613 [Plicaturopsis crispa FD-325 SS-3]